MTKQHKLLSLAACMSAALVASSAMAAETPAAQTSAKEVLPRTLEGYVSQDKAFWDYLKANHPYFKYLKEGRVVGKFTMSDREEEWVDFGGGDKYREDTGRTTAVTYRLPYESFLDLPNNFVGPKKCGECHPSQYEKWERSRHNKIVRFPEEMTEAVVQGDLKRPLYGSSVVPTTSKTAATSPRLPVRSLPAATSSPATGPNTSPLKLPRRSTHGIRPSRPSSKTSVLRAPRSGV